jgi:hypothetical protein
MLSVLASRQGEAGRRMTPLNPAERCAGLPRKRQWSGLLMGKSLVRELLAEMPEELFGGIRLCMLRGLVERGHSFQVT